MAQNDVVERFKELSERYDHMHRPGAALQLKDELGLGSGRFNDKLTTEELGKLNEELEKELTSPE